MKLKKMEIKKMKKLDVLKSVKKKLNFHFFVVQTVILFIIFVFLGLFLNSRLT